MSGGVGVTEMLLRKAALPVPKAEDDSTRVKFTSTVALVMRLVPLGEPLIVLST